MIRFLWLSFLFLLCYYIVTAIFGLLRGSVHQPPPEKSSEGETMVRDPQCGTFVPRSLALRKVVKGKTYFFCSEECLKRFEKSSKGL